MRRLDRRDHQQRHARRTCTLADGGAIRVELGGIQVAVRIDPEGHAARRQQDRSAGRIGGQSGSEGFR